MLFRSSSSASENLESKAKEKQLGLKSFFGKIKINYFINSLSIAKKIGYGYSVSIGLAILGTTSGLVIADYYEKQAQIQLELAYQQEDMLRNLENAVMTTRLHPQRLVTVIEDSVWLEFEKNKFLAHVEQVKIFLSELEFFIKKNPNHLAVEYEYLTNILQKYQKNTESYSTLIKSFWEKIDSNKLEMKKTSSNQSEFMVIMKGKEAARINVTFELISEELSRILIRAKTQKQHANTSFSHAQALRLQTIFGSMLLSVAIAAALALYTSGGIARPLLAVTDVARKITQEQDFDLRSPVTSTDEVGTLATSLNQLVQWVGDYTHELEVSRQTLEQRVEERTQELKLALQDLQETQGQLIQTEKMSSLGQMVAGVAHEINNPVNFIYGNIECASCYFQDLLDLIHLYQQQYPNQNKIIEEKIQEIEFEFLSNDLFKMLSSMKIGAQRIREIVLSLRNFSRLDEAEMKEVDIHEGIDNTLLILNHRIKQEIEIIKKYGNLPLVECYPAQLNQVFMNILSNAIDALIDENVSSNKQIAIETSKLNNNQVKIVIKDNGPGIPSEIKNKLFDPFFTTKPVGKGTGLGLSICYKIIEKHKGNIEVVSDLGKGTEFILTLPIK
ncbi:histidine kinase [Scytonema hofmannii PCC 7110]|uniref:histidine kinase n=1 Tax=Scytonema hofmannii PCC 7110 TaxID=128403 RepID=A0A139X0Q6_9CYAN|nr:ATP-binding protein [Scytonema hofmannii]KYC38285.1 histidine kinase [Scytonema hofmannii PCC 7110]